MSHLLSFPPWILILKGTSGNNGSYIPLTKDRKALHRVCSYKIGLRMILSFFLKIKFLNKLQAILESSLFVVISCLKLLILPFSSVRLVTLFSLPFYPFPWWQKHKITVGRQVYGDREQISGHWGTGMGGEGTNKGVA